MPQSTGNNKGEHAEVLSARQQLHRGARMGQATQKTVTAQVSSTRCVAQHLARIQLCRRARVLFRSLNQQGRLTRVSLRNEAKTSVR